MKILIYFLFVVLLNSCSKEKTYTINGVFLNGTTNKPYQNIKVDFKKIVGTPGFNRYSDLGDTYTDEDGAFSFDYSTGEHENSKLWVLFSTKELGELLSKSDITIAQDNTLNFYLSDSCRTLFTFETNTPLADNEILKLYALNRAFDTLYFNKSDLIKLNSKFIVRTKNMFSIAYERISPDTSIITYPLGTEMEGDPIINNISIKY